MPIHVPHLHRNFSSLFLVAVSAICAAACMEAGVPSSGGDCSSGKCDEIVEPDETRLVEVVAGGYHSCALRGNRTVTCWGDNEYGQLGNGAVSEESSTAVTVSELEDAIALSAGDSHTCALIGDGSVRCWGEYHYGFISDESEQHRSTVPVAIADLSGVVAISSGANFTCALLDEGSVQCWGDHDGGNFGNDIYGDRTKPAKIAGIEGAVAITSGNTFHACALIDDGTVQCWGRNIDGQLGDGTEEKRDAPVGVLDIGGAVALAAGDAFACAIVAEGAIQCWGFNDEEVGQAMPPEGEFRNITAGFEHGCAIRMDDTVECWGDDSSGQSSPPEGKFARLSTGSGSYHTCGITLEGAVECWGYNRRGQLNFSDPTPAD